MEWTDSLYKCAASLVTVSTGFFVAVALCSSAFFQRQIFYAHKVPIWLGQNLNKPESFGFLHNQVFILSILTADGQTLFGWLVTPLASYAKHERDFLRGCQDEQPRKTSVELLQDPKSRLVIYFHGTAGTIGQTRRTDAYRMVSSAPGGIHVLAFDYRGFGRSTGNPTESGLLEDALAVIRWATTIAKVPTNRIVLLAQSLGTAVAIAAADALICNDPTTEFAGIILCAAFTDAPSVFTSYKLGGKFPFLAPLKAFTPLETWFAHRIRDKWDTRQRLGRLTQRSKNLRLVFFASQNDQVIPFRHTNSLFHSTLRKTLGNLSTDEELEEQCEHLDLAEGGNIVRWQDGGILLKKVLVRYGGSSNRSLPYHFVFIVNLVSAHIF
ncbi:MAG: hypothetical protein Q9227_003986 [Pyrenula ochraceoflavens]